MFTSNSLKCTEIHNEIFFCPLSSWTKLKMFYLLSQIILVENLLSRKQFTNKHCLITILQWVRFDQVYNFRKVVCNNYVLPLQSLTRRLRWLNNLKLLIIPNQVVLRELSRVLWTYSKHNSKRQIHEQTRVFTSR